MPDNAALDAGDKGWGRGTGPASRQCLWVSGETRNLELTEVSLVFQVSLKPYSLEQPEAS